MTRPMTVSGPTRTQPRWSPEYLDRPNLVKGGLHFDVAQFLASDAVRVTVGAAGAAVDAVTVPVAALAGPIPTGTVLDFGGKKFARLTAAAAAGAVSVTVAALPTALVQNDTATYAGVGLRSVLAGTYVGRTLAERAAGTGYGPISAADEDRVLVAFNCADILTEPTFTGVKRGTQVWENYLPGFSSLPGAVQTLLRQDYLSSIGAD